MIKILSSINKFRIRSGKWFWLILVLIAIVLFFIFKGKPAKTVATTTIQKGTVSENLVLSGEVKATNYAKLSFETSGKIVYVGVKTGDIVRKGRLLSNLDATILNSSYEQALSSLRAANATLEKTYDQVKDHASDETFSQKELRTSAEVAKDRAYESVIQAKRLLAGASLYAPFDGIITNVTNPYTGVYIALGQPQIEIVDPKTIYLSVTVDQTDLGKIVDKSICSITFDAFPDEVYKGTIENVSFVPKEGEVEIVYEIKISIDDLEKSINKLKIGMTADASFTLNSKDNVLYLPPQYIKEDAKGKYILLNDERRYIKTGLEGDERIEVEGDVKEGDLVSG